MNEFSDILLVTVLTDAGMDVTVSSIYEHEWNGTNPPLDDFDVVVLCDGCFPSRSHDMPTSGQLALLDFVDSGGGLLLTEWVTEENHYDGAYSSMADLVLFDPAQHAYLEDDDWLVVSTAHPVTAGVSAFFWMPRLVGSAGWAKPGVTVLVTGYHSNDAVAVKEYGSGRIVHFGVAGNCYDQPFIESADMGKLLSNAATWASEKKRAGYVFARVGVTNNGCNRVEGSIGFTVRPFYQDAVDMAIDPSTSMDHTFAIRVQEAVPGDYPVLAQFVREGAVLAEASAALHVAGPDLIIETAPSSLSYQAGQPGSMTVRVQNAGAQEGRFTLGASCADFYEDVRAGWIGPGKSVNVKFDLLVPEDLPGGTYSMLLTFQDEVVQEIPVTVAGADVSVTAALDSSLYQVGDDATLELTVVNNTAIAWEMSAHVQLGDDGQTQSFTLDGDATLVFVLPVGSTDLTRIHYSVNLASGRSLYINSALLRVQSGPVTLYTDKDEYSPGDTVTATAVAASAGDLDIVAPGFEEVIAVPGGES